MIVKGSQVTGVAQQVMRNKPAQEGPEKAPTVQERPGPAMGAGADRLGICIASSSASTAER